MTDYRRKKAAQTAKKYLPHDMETIAKSLRVSQAFKYAQVEAWLRKKGIRYRIEEVVGRRIFDLALPDTKVFVEFDAKHHAYPSQSGIDKEKDELARKRGWRVLRVGHIRNKAVKLKDFLRVVFPRRLRIMAQG